MNYEFSGFRLVGGSNQTGASALRVTGAGNFSGLILIENVDFDNNQSTSFSATAGAVQIDNLGGSNGRIVLRSSRFYNNRISDTDPVQGTAAALRVRARAERSQERHRQRDLHPIVGRLRMCSSFPKNWMGHVTRRAMFRSAAD